MDTLSIGKVAKQADIGIETIPCSSFPKNLISPVLKSVTVVSYAKSPFIVTEGVADTGTLRVTAEKFCKPTVQSFAVFRYAISSVSVKAVDAPVTSVPIVI